MTRRWKDERNKNVEDRCTSLSVLGTYFLYSKQFDFLMILPASAIGLLSAGVLNLNNMRDLESDKLSDKHTLAGYLGSINSKTYHQLLIVIAMVLMSVYSFLSVNSSMYLMLISFIPLFFHLHIINKIKAPKDYDPQLKVLALSTVALALFFCASLL